MRSGDRPLLRTRNAFLTAVVFAVVFVSAQGAFLFPQLIFDLLVESIRSHNIALFEGRLRLMGQFREASEAS